MNIIEKMNKNYVEIKKYDFLENKTVKTFFLVQILYSRSGYLASIMF